MRARPVGGLRVCIDLRHQLRRKRHIPEFLSQNFNSVGSVFGLLPPFFDQLPVGLFGPEFFPNEVAVPGNRLVLQPGDHVAGLTLDREHRSGHTPRSR